MCKIEVLVWNTNYVKKRGLDLEHELNVWLCEVIADIRARTHVMGDHPYNGGNPSFTDGTDVLLPERTGCPFLYARNYAFFCIVLVNPNAQGGPFL